MFKTPRIRGPLFHCVKAIKQKMFKTSQQIFVIQGTYMWC